MPGSPKTIPAIKNWCLNRDSSRKREERLVEKREGVATRGGLHLPGRERDPTAQNKGGSQSLPLEDGGGGGRQGERKKSTAFGKKKRGGGTPAGGTHLSDGLPGNTLNHDAETVRGYWGKREVRTKKKKKRPGGVRF